MRKIIPALVLLFATSSPAAEVMAPAAPPPTVQVPNYYHISEIRLVPDPAFIGIVVKPGMTDGTCAKNVDGSCQIISVNYEGEEAVKYLNWLNTANFTNNSMINRLLTKLAADGYIPPGSVSGAPGIPTYTPTPTLTLTPTLTPTEIDTATPTPAGTETNTVEPQVTPSPEVM